MMHLPMRWRAASRPHGRRRLATPRLESLEGRALLSLTPVDFSAAISSGSVTSGSNMFFVADDGAHGKELWKSDGTSAGTSMVKDINPGLFSSAPNNLTDVGGTLYFSASDGAHGQELWKSDGTDAGTVMVKDVIPGSIG